MFKSNIATLGFLCLAMHFGLPALASSAYEDAMNEFRSKRFHAASDLFQKSIKEQPSNAQAYYWLGKTLEQLKDRDGAKTMYEACYRLNPFSPEARQAKQALLDLVNSNAVLQHPVDSPQIVQQTIRTIARQADDWKQTKINYGETNARYRINLGTYGYWKQLDDIQRGTFWGAAGSNYRATPFYYDVTGRRELSNQAQIEASYRVTDNRVQARKYQRDAVNSAYELQRSANNLTDLLSQPKRLSEPNLRALGTNLFVRNYAEFDRDDLAPQDPPLELRASASKLIDSTPQLHTLRKQTSASIN